MAVLSQHTEQNGKLGQWGGDRERRGMKGMEFSFKHSSGYKIFYFFSSHHMAKKSCLAFVFSTVYLWVIFLC